MKRKIHKKLKKVLRRTFKKTVHKTLALTIVLSFLFQIGFPTCALALTGGPSQPEVQGFEPVSTSDMVDLFSGSFVYNIPLLNVDGYPINISYHSGVTMDQEASWVGLGWSINPGVINRNVRGIPDDFDGEAITKEFNMKKNETYGVNLGAGFELFGLPLSLNASLGMKYNNYTGVGADVGLTVSISSGSSAKTNLTGSLGLTASSDDGVTVAPSIGLSYTTSKDATQETTLGLHVGTSFNSRQGVSNLTVGADVSRTDKITNDKTKKVNSVDGGSEGVHTAFNCMMPTYTPQVTMPMSNLSINGSIKVGLELFGGHGSANIGGYYSSQELSQTTIQNPAYGYMHADEGVHNPNAMMDFNREKDGAFTQNTPDLPVTNFTYDILSVSGQGTSGSYRSFRSDLGHVFDPSSYSTSDGYNIGFELGAGNAVHAGGDFSMNTVNSTSGDWTADNWAASTGLSYKSSTGNPLYEKAYFKDANEKTVEADPGFFNSVGGTSPENVLLNQYADFYTVASNSYSSGLPVTSHNYRDTRDIRNQDITILNRSQLKDFALEDPDSLNLYSGAEPYHMAEITSLGTDGKRYVYGIAAYNTRKEETTFAVDGSTANAKTGLVHYSEGADNSIKNAEGRDNYYNNVITPPYAHSYLLTAVLSPDYVDADSIRGPSAGDMGTWTKFSYTKVTPYKWRIPLGHDSATFNEGLKSDPNDDKANYIYGEKELYYLNSIETKNYVATFTTLARQDAFGVQDKNGAVNFDTNYGSRYLSKISLYTKPNYEAHAANPSIPLVPVEEVHFEYDYSLCKGVPNNSTPGNGKLTLKRIYFTYQNSFKGRLSPYEFTYSSFNPNYNIKSYDRWGYYRPNTAYSSFTDPTTGDLSPSDYPYVEQNKADADQWVTAWTLTDIDLPSGGSIHVDYESNDYAYVQNQPAGEMFRVDGSSMTKPTPSMVYTAIGSNAALSDGTYNNYYLTFPLQKDENGIYIKDSSKYFTGINYLYFRFLMKVSATVPTYEYVSGYVPTAGISYGLVDSTHGWVRLPGIDLDDNSSGLYSPIIKSALQYGRINCPRAMWDEPDISGPFGESVLKAFASAFSQLGTLTKGENGYLFGKGDGQQFVSLKSWFRLNCPSGYKFGGGARVKDIHMSDEWSGMTGGAEPSFDYGQQYIYTTTSPSGVTISSGVACYEPQAGGDENPLKQPVFYDTKNLMVPDDEHYLETPFGECFYPSPSVGYSRVTVENLQRTGVSRDATGSVVHEFYTSYDFPTITSQTSVQEIREKTDPLSISSLLSLDVRDYMTASQGYVIETNDMNGKPKAQYVYQEGQKTAISSVQYFYKRQPYLESSFKVDNTATVINRDGSVNNNATIGMFFDDVADFRQSETDNLGVATQVNFDMFLLGFIPVPVPIALPQFSSETTRFRSAVVTKVIQHFGLLDSTIVTDLGSTVKTQNLAYDAQSGEVLLTKTANDFNDSIFNLTYPAYWYYEGMGAAYQNIGLTMNGVTFYGNTGANISNASRYFVPGDELALTQGNIGMRAWVISLNGNNVIAEFKDGTPVSGKYNLEVIRSGRRNMQTMDIGKLTSLVDPLYSLQSNSYQKVTQASAKLYADGWRTYCNCFDDSTMKTDNPYVLGIRGNYRLKTSFLYLTPRDQDNFDENTNIRRDGTFTSYNPYYANIGGVWTAKPENWTFTSTVTDFNPYGQEIEDKDALGRYSSATFGYNQTLPTAVAANSQYQEMGFDGFEDYGFKGCADNHLNVNRSAVTIDSTQWHTGWHSLKVSHGNPVIIGGDLSNCQPYNPCIISLCYKIKGDTITLDPVDGAPPYSISWTGGKIDSNTTYTYLDSNGCLGVVPTFVGSEAIPLTVTVKDSKGCSYEAQVSISESLTVTGATQCSDSCSMSLCYTTSPVSNPPHPNSIVIQGTGGTAPYSIASYLEIVPDSFNLVPMADGLHVNFTGSSRGTGSFSVTIEDSKGCSSTATVSFDGDVIDGISSCAP